MNEAKRKLDRLFEFLIEDGFATIRGNICCRNCATSALNGEHPEGTPAAYYTKQDVGDGLGNRVEFEDVYIGFGPLGADGFEDEEAYREVGERIVELAEEANVPVDWDGDPHCRILVNPTD